MPNHDRYDNDILKQLTRIANSLEKIETMLYGELIFGSESLKNNIEKDLGHGVTPNVDIDGLKALTFVPNAAREAVGLKPVIVSKED